MEALAFGHATIPVAWPREIEPEILRPAAGAGPPAAHLADEARALALDLAADRPGRVVVLVPDRTRAFPLANVLPPLLATLHQHGVAPGHVTVAIASGTHLAHDADVDRHHLGELPAGTHVLRHDPVGPLASFGVTSAGTPVRVNPILAQADAIASLDAVSFHYFAGFGGGWKMPFPGLGGRDAVAANHRLALAPWPPGGLAAGVEPGELARNPVAHDLREAAERLPQVRHLTLWPADSGYAACRWTRPAEFVALCERYAAGRRHGGRGSFDVVVASAGGWPRDLDLVQAHKALFHGALYVRPGGTVVLVAACDEGAGSRALERWLVARDLDTLESEARRDYDLNAQTAISLARLARRVHVRWIARNPVPDLARWGVDFAPEISATVADACARARAESGRPARVAVLPVASDVLPAPVVDLPSVDAPAALGAA